jgi:4-carboxymuconolactone decarboxylase
MASEAFELGKRVRGEISGKEVVEGQLEGADDFMRPIQELVTEFAFGAVWARPELDRRTRSMLNVAMLAVLNKPDELAGHVRGAITNGVTPTEIREVLLQVAAYAGVPAGLSGSKIAHRVLTELGVELAD